MAEQTPPDLPPCARLREGPGGLSRLEVRDPGRGDLDLYLHGAHVTGWTPPGHQQVLFLSPAADYRADAAIRGGVPICFPWFGGGPEGTLTPSHGFARTSTWQLDSVEQDDDGLTVQLELPAAAPTWLGASYRVTVGETLSLTLTAHNRAEDDAWCEAALHTYLSVGDVRQVAVRGLAGASYLDRLGGPELVRQDAEVLRLFGETDRIYQHSDADVAVDDPVLARRVTVRKSGSASTVVWNPWERTAAAMADLDGWHSMLCVETANVRGDRVVLAPGASHAMRAVLEVERL